MSLVDTFWHRRLVILASGVVTVDGDVLAERERSREMGRGELDETDGSYIGGSGNLATCRSHLECGVERKEPWRYFSLPYSPFTLFSALPQISSGR